MGMPKVTSIKTKIKLIEIAKGGHGNIKYTNADKLVFLRLEQTFNFIFVSGRLYDCRRNK